MASAVYDSYRNTNPLQIDEYFLRSDYTPTRTEVNEHSQALEADYHPLEHCNEELEREREETMERIRLREGVLTLIRRVPVEVWRRIFSFVCLSLEQSSVCINATTTIEVCALPHVLLHVCARWFHIVNGFPQLWSSIFITTQFRGTQGFAPILQSLLAKSGNSSLTIRLNYSNYHGDHSFDEIEYVRAHAFSRCKHLTVDYYWWKSLIQNTINLSFPMLESFKTEGLSNTSHTRCTLSKLDLPRLSQLTISEPHLVPQYPHLPYTQLTSLELVYATGIAGFLIKVLPLCSKLQSLVTPFHFRYMIHLGNPVTTPSLQHLRLYISCFQKDLFHLFKHFEFPNLSSLEISERHADLNTPSPPTYHEYRTCFQRSLPRLQNLTFRFFCVQGEDTSPDHRISSLQNILAASPSLTSLRLIHESSAEPKFSRFGTKYGIKLSIFNTKFSIFNTLPHLLTIDSGSRDILLPKLTSLLIYPCEFPCFNCRVTTSEKIEMERNILNMVESRGRYSKLSELCLGYRTQNSICKCEDHGISTFLEGLEVPLKQYELKCRSREVEKFEFRNYAY